MMFASITIKNPPTIKRWDSRTNRVGENQTQHPRPTAAQVLLLRESNSACKLMQPAFTGRMLDRYVFMRQ
ncbi:MAG: hypothetical protein A2X46_05725 [Lentisphaerae bacterium GWF2_57_35]|nr:MAG: hypothetical protein A2X46_05725 [Lentisphaerae bacterium GWF2_57_35]